MTEDFRIHFLIVDDQQSIRKLCVTIGASLGFACDEAENAEAALQFLEANSPDIVLVDLRMAEMSGLEFLAAVKKMLPRTEVAIMTGYGSIESAVQAMKLGAYDYITKPFRVEELKMTLQRMSEKVRLVAENEFLRERFKTETEMHGIVGSHAKIQDILRMIARLKDTRTPVLVTGESGTGKELVARAIHFQGMLARAPFIVVDCAAIVPSLVESELFGHQGKSFTGSDTKAKRGLLEAAEGGTIFLDEIGELPLDIQGRLLGFLQKGTIRPVGLDVVPSFTGALTSEIEQGSSEIVRIPGAGGYVHKNYYLEIGEGKSRETVLVRSASADEFQISCRLPHPKGTVVRTVTGSERKLNVRVIAATNKDLETEYQVGRFRKDLYFRLNVVNVHIPPLRERRSDIPSLAHWFLDKYSMESRIVITPAAMTCLLQYDWPGNVRELENCIERAVALGNREIIDVNDLTPSIRSVEGQTQLSQVSGPSATDLEEIEKVTIQRVFEQVNGDKDLAGKLLGISRATLYRKIKRYNILMKPRMRSVAARV